MPIYEYRCEQCGYQFELLQKVGAEPPPHCPHCGKSAIHKLVSETSFRLKGEGWYQTDFKDQKKKPEKPAKSCSCENCPHKD